MRYNIGTKNTRKYKSKDKYKNIKKQKTLDLQGF